MSRSKDMRQCGPLLAEGLDTLGIESGPGQRDQLIAYLELMQRWNQAQRLTAITDPEEMVIRHLLDSLSIRGWIRGESVLDVGSGAGLPGIPLAILEPAIQFTLLDSQAKRCHFLFQVRVELGLANVSVVESRAETYRPEQPFDMVISRAFADLRQFVELAARHCRPGGRMLAMKGRYPGAEIEALQMPYTVAACHRLAVPGLDAERHLVEISISDGTAVSDQHSRKHS